MDILVIALIIVVVLSILVLRLMCAVFGPLEKYGSTPMEETIPEASSDK